MNAVQTVTGPISIVELGHCQIHEHIFANATPMSKRNPALCMDRFDASIRELLTYRAAGGISLADAQPVAAGRDARVLARISMQSGVFVIASTGYHLLGFYPENCWIHALDEEGLYELFCRELNRGMLPWLPDASLQPKEDTGIRAGIVKAAIPAEGPTGRYAVLLQAAARAAADCGVPLMLHTEMGLSVLPALDICFGAEMRPEKIIVCHADRQTEDISRHEQIAERGVYLDYDTVGRFKYHSDEAEIALLRHMEPYGDRILLSLDTTAARLAAYGGTIGLDYLLTDFRKQLLRAGFHGEKAARYNESNCQRLFNS